MGQDGKDGQWVETINLKDERWQLLMKCDRLLTRVVYVTRKDRDETVESFEARMQDGALVEPWMQASSRAIGRRVNMQEMEVHELRDMSASLVTSVRQQKAKDDNVEFYPDGWRGSI